MDPYRYKSSHLTMHRGAICQFLFRWIHYRHSSKSTRKKTSKTHLCALGQFDIRGYTLMTFTLRSFAIVGMLCPMPCCMYIESTTIAAFYAYALTLCYTVSRLFKAVALKSRNYVVGDGSSRSRAPPQNS